ANRKDRLVLPGVRGIDRGIALQTEERLLDDGELLRLRRRAQLGELFAELDVIEAAVERSHERATRLSPSLLGVVLADEPHRARDRRRRAANSQAIEVLLRDRIGGHRGKCRARTLQQKRRAAKGPPPL